MEAKDLRVEPPRRWSDRIDGIVWLPRLIDKARAAAAGTLGSYLYGQSPTDTGMLHALGVGYRQFTAIVSAAPDDAAVVAALRERDGSSLERARAFGDEFARRYKWFHLLLDLDDGYREGAVRRLRPGLNALSAAFTWAIKRVWPSRASDRASRT